MRIGIGKLVKFQYNKDIAVKIRAAGEDYEECLPE
jgi:hypothetical protein